MPNIHTSRKEKFRKPCQDLHGFNFLIKHFSSNLRLKVPSTVILTNHQQLDLKDLSYITNSQFSHFSINKLFLPTSREVLPTFQKYCPVRVSFCPDGSSFCPLSSSGQDKGFFGVGLGPILYVQNPERGM